MPLITRETDPAPPSLKACVAQDPVESRMRERTLMQTMLLSLATPYLVPLRQHFSPRKAQSRRARTQPDQQYACRGQHRP
jgi:hypothetical protein